MNFHRTRIRLDPFTYRGKGIYFLTICCHNRHPVFTKMSAGKWLVKWLTRCAAHHAYSVHAYCLMPDHLHVLTEGTHETCHVPKFISELKQRTGHPYQQKLGRRLWQPAITTTSYATLKKSKT